MLLHIQHCKQLSCQGSSITFITNRSSIGSWHPVHTFMCLWLPFCPQLAFPANRRQTTTSDRALKHSTRYRRSFRYVQLTDYFRGLPVAVIFHSHRERSSGADKRPRPTTTQTRPRLAPDVFKYSNWQRYYILCFLRTELVYSCKLVTILLFVQLFLRAIDFCAFVVYNLRFSRGIRRTRHPPVWWIGKRAWFLEYGRNCQW